MNAIQAPTTDNRKWLDPVIAKVTANLGNKYKNASYELSVPKDSFFVSTVFFVRLVTNSSTAKDKQTETVSLVVKKPMQCDHMREFLEADAQFHNEILFYDRYAYDDDALPRCFYTQEKPASDALIVLEDITARGYGPSRWKYDVPLEYTLAAFREIARFHAKGYAMREREPNKFFDLLNHIHETRYKWEGTFRVVINGTASRAVDYLRTLGYDKDFCDRLGIQFRDVFSNVMPKFIAPEQQLATLCHGDFTMNNTFFKRENGQLKAMIFDFALMRYGSPVIDLSTFLCLHCARDLDTDLLDKVLPAYHDHLQKFLREYGVQDPNKFSYRALHDDYKRKGLFGFFIATFFLSTVMGKNAVSPEEMGTNIEEWPVILRELGGDEISEILANMLLKLKEFGCLESII